MKVVVTGGGSGGHVYPALAVVAAMAQGRGSRSASRSAVLYVGSGRGMERAIVERAAVAFAAISAGGLRGRSPFHLLLNLGRMVLGLVQAWSIMRRFRPEGILATGGYVSVPVVLAGWLNRVPVLLYLPDSEPGWAIQTLTPFATRIALTAHTVQRSLPARKTVVTGYPVRPQLLGQDKAQAKAHFSMDPALPTLLVMGGSQGAHVINETLHQILPSLLSLCQIIHLCGPEHEATSARVREALSPELRRRYLVYGYLHEELPLALAAAEFAVSRAGASVLGEFPAAGLPSVLIPYPYAGKHQHRNAALLTEAGAALTLEEAQIPQLLPTILALLGDRTRLAAMAEAARRFFRPDAAQHIADLLSEMGGSLPLETDAARQEKAHVDG